MTYEMTNPVVSADIIMYVLGVFVILLGIFIIVLMISSKHYSLEVGNQNIVIKSVFYNTNISLSDIDIVKVKRINLNESDIKINARQNGIGLPGLLVGWFSSSEGRLKLYISDKSEVLYIPTKLKYTILFSTKKADEIINVINNVGTDK
jgi:hypothetical protein